MSAFNKSGNVHSPDFKYTGEEPDFHGWESWDVEKFYTKRSRALNFYNYYLASPDLKPLVLTWMKVQNYSKDAISRIKEASPSVLPTTVGKLIRCFDRGMPHIHPKAQEYYNQLPFHETPPIAKSDLKVVKEGIDAALVFLGAYAIDDSTVEAKVKVVRQSPLDRIRENVRKDILIVLDELIDRWVDTSQGVATINVAAMLKTYKVPAQGCKMIIDWLEYHQSGYNDALEKNCNQAVEGYSYLSKPDLKKIVKCFDVMLSDVRMHSKAKMADRKPRIKKTKDATKQILKLKYQINSSTFNLDSISPIRIPGAQRLYVFNTKYRTLAVYFAKGSPGFAVKGSSLQDWDMDASFNITLRKPKDVLLGILAATPKKLDKIFDGVKVVHKKASGRFNEHCIILKVIETKL